MNATMTTSDSTALYMPDSDSDFDDFIENDFVKFLMSFAVQNLCFTVFEFT